MAETIFLHVDMDAFFAAVEQREQPELRGKPVIIGAAPDARGVVSTCSYEARRFGVHSAMPSRTAYRLCPHGVFLPVRGALYRRVSGEIFAIFSRFSPYVEGLSIDEAFIDITGSQQLFGGPVAAARKLRAAIAAELQLTASVGVAPNKFLAKLASDMDKPDGLTVVPREPAAIEAFLAPLPVRRIWGVGEKTAATLKRGGLQTIGDVQQLREEELRHLLGDAAGRHIYRLAHGRDTREIAPETVEKSISHEHTFGQDTRDWAVLEQVLVGLIEKVGGRLRQQGKVARTVHLKLRWAPFQTITRQRRTTPTASDRELIRLGLELLERERCRRAVRLIGFGVGDLAAADAEIPYQPDLFDPVDDDEQQRNTELDAAVDEVRRRLGPGAVGRGQWRGRKHQAPVPRRQAPQWPET